MLDTLKLLLGITDDTQDALLTYLLDSVESKVRRFCKIHAEEPLDKGLQDVLIEIGVQRYRAAGYGRAAAPQTVVSLSDNGQEVRYAAQIDNAAVQAASGLTDRETAMLCEWRRLWW